MKELRTKYGVIRGIASLECYENGSIKECILENPNELITRYGKLVPQYEEDHVRRKYTSSLSFYESGNIKSISLNDQTKIATSIGVFPAEKLTFYEDGSLKRLFPTNGKLTGYWTEDHEYALAKNYQFDFSFGKVDCKIISIHFYRSQKVKSITLWPKEQVAVKLNGTLVQLRTGIALYETGEIKSCEPAEAIPVHTPIGIIIAYDTDTIGIHGDNNSLQFYKDGTLKAVVSSTDKIEIYDQSYNKITYLPQETSRSLNPNGVGVTTLHLLFENGKIIINDEVAYNLDGHSFVVTNYFKKIIKTCGECSNCNLCD
ncbi:MAG: hypothetical protein K0S71_2109 [Clostridia bacterium]|jgi:hypothetical protein|nr:hypothetical protein [Clostridia bacterium]